MEAGNIYIIETTDLLKDIPDGGKLMEILTGLELPMIVAPADCLFHMGSNSSGNAVLRPIAIRLEYTNGKHSETYWFPPHPETNELSSSYLSWLLAKMYFKSANIQVYRKLKLYTF